MMVIVDISSSDRYGDETDAPARSRPLRTPHLRPMLPLPDHYRNQVEGGPPPQRMLILEAVNLLPKAIEIGASMLPAVRSCRETMIHDSSAIVRAQDGTIC